MAPDVPKQMKAQVLEEYHKPYAYVDLPVPSSASENDLIVKVDAAGYCHTDAVLAAGEYAPNPRNFPHVSSHEFAGTVVQSNSSAAAKEYPVGTRVGVPGLGYHACGNCFKCHKSKDEGESYSLFCANAESNGISKHGGFSEYQVVDARQLAPLPDAMEATDAAPLMCAGVTIYQALKRCHLSAGQRVGIVGCGGGLGHLGLQFAEAMGLRTTGIDASDGPLQLAKSLETKADIVDARATKAEEVVKRVGKEDGKTDEDDMGLDAVIILPESQASFDYGMKLLRNHALCVLVSFPEKGFHVDSRDLVFRDIAVVGSLLGHISVLREMVAFAAKHKVKAVKKTYPLAKLNELVDEYKKGGGGKLVVDMTL